ncbi:MAG: PAS domain-containing sensor histidine kinase [Sporocytophaga sp.]|nr:PAS domain-containing sensor histidine kinase [Sporocytophaga sp.]
MHEFLKNILEGDFMPHGHCYFWKPEILWSHAIADSVIALAYFSIPFSLYYIFRLRRDFLYGRLMLLFAFFIFGCGATHLVSVITIWNPFYRLDAVLKFITAVASIATAVILIKKTPQILQIPSANDWRRLHSELKNSNEKLKESNEELLKADEVLRKINWELEERVKYRTEELEASILQFKFMTDSISQLVFTVNEKGEFDYFNLNWYEYSGLDSRQSFQRGVFEITHPEDLEELSTFWRLALEEGTVFRCTGRLKDKTSEEYRWHLIEANPLKDSFGNVVKWFGTCTDVNDEKIYRKELERTNKELKRINTDLDNFVYTASHDLKAPISNLEGLVNSLSQELQSNNYSQEFDLYLNMMKNSILRFKTTISELSDISKIQKDTEEDVDLVNIRELLDEIFLVHHDTIITARTQISINLKITQISFSRKNLRSLFTNLITNAIKYRSPLRRPEITIASEINNDILILTVSDNGLGIETKQLDKVFGMFKRVHTHVDGTGVGLYIVKRIVENAGGKITLNSIVNVGTTFSIQLPLKKEIIL